MAYTFFDYLRDISAALGGLTVFTASDGDVSMAEDAARAGHGRDNDWQGATLFVLAAGGEAPQGEFAAVIGYLANAGRFTVSPPFSAAIQAGDALGLAAGAVPLGALAELANAGLRALGEIPQSDDQSLTSGARDYALPETWGRVRLVDVALPGGGWAAVRDWAAHENALALHEALPPGRALRVTWLAAHPRLSAAADLVSPAVAPELAVAAGAEQALRWLSARQPGDAALAAQWEDARQRLARSQAAFPIRAPGRLARLLDAGGAAWA